MCQHGSKIKFCSCDTDKLDPPFPYWVLYREVGQEYMNIMGVFLPPEMPDALDEVTIQAVSEALNAEGAFDFEYAPCLRDKFVLYVTKNKKMDFVCMEDYDSEEGLLVWRYELFSTHFADDFEKIESGKLISR